MDYYVTVKVSCGKRFCIYRNKQCEFLCAGENDWWCNLSGSKLDATGDVEPIRDAQCFIRIEGAK